MKRTATVLAVLAAVVSLAGPAHANGGAGPVSTATASPAIVQTSTTFGCQYDVYRSHLGAQGYHVTTSHGVTTSSTDSVTGRKVSAILVSSDGRRTLEIHGTTVNGLFRIRVWHTYTDHNVKALWVSGHRCETT